MTTIALEEEIEQLSCSITWDCHGTHVPSQSWDQRKRRSQGAEQMALQGPTREQPSPLPSMQPSTMAGQGGRVRPGPPPELRPDVERFFCGPAGKEDKEGYLPAEPQLESTVNGSNGEGWLQTPQNGGESWKWCWRWMISKSWPKRYGPPSNSPVRRVWSIPSRTIIWPHWHPIVSTKRIFSHHQI